MGDLFHNSNFVVGIAFVLFLLVLWYFKVPSLIAGALDRRAARIKEELDEARRLREEAQSLLASYERKQKEVEGQVQDIVAHARTEAEEAAVQAKKDLEVSHRSGACGRPRSRSSRPRTAPSARSATRRSGSPWPRRATRSARA